MHEKAGRQKGLTVVGVVEVDDFLPAVVSHRIDDGAMVIRSHTYGEVQEARGWRQDLGTVIPVHFHAFSAIIGLGSLAKFRTNDRKSYPAEHLT